MKPNLNIALFCLMITVTAALPSLAAQEGEKKKNEQQATLIGVDKVLQEPLKQTVPVIGRLVAAQAGVVAARAGGPIAEMRVKVGDRAEKGSVIAVLVKDSLYWKHQLDVAEAKKAVAALKTSTAERDLRVQELKRLKKLKKSAAFSQARLDDKNQEVVLAESAMAEAEAALIRTRANAKLSEINLHNATIRAPFTGVVSQRHTDVGAYVSVGTPVVSMIDDKHLEIEANVPSERIEGLTPGTLVGFRLENAGGGKSPELFAAVRATVPDEDPLTRTRTVRFTPDFGIEARNLAANQSVIIALPAGEERNVVTVHKDAVLNRKGKNIVYIVEDGTANIRPLDLGEATGTRFTVKQGLEPGDLVVVRGNERLRPGQKVRHEP